MEFSRPEYWSGEVSSIFSGYLNCDHFKKLNLKPTVAKQQLLIIVNSGSDKPCKILSSDLYIRMNPEAVLVYRVATSAYKTIWIDAHTGKTVCENSMISNWAVVQAKDDTNTNRWLDVKDVNYGLIDYYYLYHDVYKTAVYRLDESSVSNRYYNGDNPDIISDGGFVSYSQNATRSNVTDRAFPEPGNWDGQAVSAYYNFIKVRNRYSSKRYYGLNGRAGASPLFVHADDIFLALGGDGDWDGILDETNAAYISPTLGIGYDQIHFSNQHGTVASMVNDQSVIGHEFGHAVVFNHNAQGTNLSTLFMRTANEAYADIFGSWVVNKWPTNPAPLRNIVDPAKSNNPAVIGDSNYAATFVEVHQNSTIISHAAYLLNSKYGYSFDDVFDVFYESVNGLSDSITTFDGIRGAVVAAARTIGFSNEKVLKIYDAFEDVGLTSPKGSAKITAKEGSKFIKHATVAISNGSTNKTGSTDDNGTIVFDDLLLGSHEVMVSVLAGPTIRTTVLVMEDEQAECVIDLLAASTDYDWDRYDHYNFDQEIGPTLDHHIEIKGKDIKMRGYTEVNYKDFLLTHENDDPDSFVHGAGKILSFSIDRDEADWHTLEGGGFLFDVSITKPSESTGNAEDDKAKDSEAEGGGTESVKEIVAGSEGFLTAHCVLVTKDGLKIYYLQDVDIALFRNGKLYAICDIGRPIGEYAYDIGDVKAHHSISINIRKGAVETISILDDSKVVVENLEVEKLDGDDYGPITSHDMHWCEQESWFTFSNIAMSNVN